MSLKVAINLPVHDLPRSTDFFAALGFAFDKRLTNEQCTAVVLNADTYVMLLAATQFTAITGRALIDPAISAEVIVQLGVESRQQVDTLVNQALAAGGRQLNATNDRGFLYGRSFQDLDGHIWDIFYIDPDA